MRNSPLSKTVPAVNESSESCSALQAYKAFAFRNGVLCENRSLFSSIFKPSESPRYLISPLPFPCKPPRCLLRQQPDKVARWQNMRWKSCKGHQRKMRIIQRKAISPEKPHFLWSHLVPCETLPRSYDTWTVGAQAGTHFWSRSSLGKGAGAGKSFLSCSGEHSQQTLLKTGNAQWVKKEKF